MAVKLHNKQFEGFLILDMGDCKKKDSVPELETVSCIYHLPHSSRSLFQSKEKLRVWIQVWDSPCYSSMDTSEETFQIDFCRPETFITLKSLSVLEKKKQGNYTIV